MFAFLPVIGTRAGGIPEGILDGKTGYLVNVDDVDKMAENVAGLYKNPHKRLGMGKEGRDYAESRFSIDLWIKEYQLKFYKLTNTA